MVAKIKEMHWYFPAKQKICWRSNFWSGSNHLSNPTILTPKKGPQGLFGAPRWVFPKIGVPQNGWFIVEHPIKMDDLGVPLFLETPRWSHGLMVRQVGGWFLPPLYEKPAGKSQKWVNRIFSRQFLGWKIHSKSVFFVDKLPRSTVVV